MIKMATISARKRTRQGASIFGSVTASADEVIADVVEEDENATHVKHNKIARLEITDTDAAFNVPLEAPTVTSDNITAMETDIEELITDEAALDIRLD